MVAEDSTWAPKYLSAYLVPQTVFHNKSEIFATNAIFLLRIFYLGIQRTSFEDTQVLKINWKMS